MSCASSWNSTAHQKIRNKIPHLLACRTVPHIFQAPVVKKTLSKNYPKMDRLSRGRPGPGPETQKTSWHQINTWRRQSHSCRQLSIFGADNHMFGAKCRYLVSAIGFLAPDINVWCRQSDSLAPNIEILRRQSDSQRQILFVVADMFELVLFGCFLFMRFLLFFICVDMLGLIICCLCMLCFDIIKLYNAMLYHAMIYYVLFIESRTKPDLKGGGPRICFFAQTMLPYSLTGTGNPSEHT